MTYANAFALNGKTPPQAVELEQAVLGALMLDQNALNNAIEVLRIESFYKPEHQTIFNAIKTLFERSEQVDLLTVTQQLSKEGKLEEVGGAYYVTSLTSHVTSAAHIEYHARILTEKYIQRELIRTSTETISDAYQETCDIIELLDKTEQKLLEISDKNFRSDYHSMDSVMFETMNQIEEAGKKDGSLSGLPTGFIQLDRMTSGLHPGTLIILAARPAMGKTAFALSIARNMAVDYNIPVAIFSLEMTRVELAMRLISGESGIDGRRIKSGQLPNWEKEMMYQRSQRLSEAPIYIDDTPQLSIFELRAKCRRLKTSHNIRMVFIDYLQLMTGGGDNSRNGNREQEISYISRQLKALSKELEVPVLALSQLSRAVETRGGSKKPILSDLRESGAIEQDADIVMFIYRPEYYEVAELDDGTSTAGLAQINLAKHRAGSTGDVNLRFIADQVKFANREEDMPSGGDSIGGMVPNNDFDNPSPTSGIPGTQTFGSKMNDDTDAIFDGEESPF